MGWTESPPLFCTATEMARDIAQEKLDSLEPLKVHPLESLRMQLLYELQCKPHELRDLWGFSV